MVRSMTGFGKSQFIDENISLEVEIKTINNRFLDFNIRMPYQLNFLEDKIKSSIKEKIVRGRVDVFIRSKNKSIGNSNVVIDVNAAKSMINSLYELAEITGFNKNEINFSDLLRNDEILKYEPDEIDEEKISNALINSINIAIDSVVSMREKEGENLKQIILEQIYQLDNKKKKIENFVSNISEELRNKLLDRLSIYLGDNQIDNDRLANEIVYYTDKVDVTEELNRLDSHLDQFRKVLENKGEIGKKLDFLTQELLRETNTISSKTSKIEVTNLCIEMKTLIEKIKEQVQNIE